MPRAAVLLADGFEEIEAITVIDVLRRADVHVAVLGVDDTEVVGAHQVRLRADGTLSERGAEPYDLVVLPGGLPGATTLRDHAGVQALLRQRAADAQPVAAICAAPIALSAAGLTRGRRATSYPGFDLDCGAYVQDRVVVDGTVTTSRGPGTALDFALQLVSNLVGPDEASRLRAAMLVDDAPD